MKTSYFTFGQSHEHNINGVRFNKNAVVKITAENPRDIMFQIFGRMWSMEYDEPPDMRLFPEGIIDLSP